MVVELPFARKIVLGPAVCLVCIDDLACVFPDYTALQLRKILRALGVPVVHFAKSAMFNLHSLEAVLHYLLRPSGPGFALPYSHEKYKPNPVHKPKTKVTKEDREAIDSAEMRRERAESGAAVLEGALKRPGLVPPDSEVDATSSSLIGHLPTGTMSLRPWAVNPNNASDVNGGPIVE